MGVLSIYDIIYIYIHKVIYEGPTTMVRFMNFPCSAGDYTVRNFVGVIEDGFPDGEESVGWCLLGRIPVSWMWKVDERCFTGHL